MLSTKSTFFILLLSLLGLTGLQSCDDGVITFTGGSARVRVFNAQLKGSSMVVEIDTQVRVNSLTNGETSPDFSLTSGLYHSFFCQSSSDSSANGIIASQRYMFADDATYLLVVHGWNITDFMNPVPEISVSPLPTKSALRVINATDTVSCSVSIDTNVVVKLADIQSFTNLYTFDPGTYVVYTNNIYANAEVDHQSFSFEPGKVYDLIVYDAPLGNGLTQRVLLREVK